ncbi:hypothetical protein [Conexibacter sp. SYSU D00693]|uniref:hypothetical protein n=1 Tax=Conexibacter sp. SYSU D00693 TaxID=2812560 RepID=UPI00196A5E4A|nr:hypothetical protein [Conexibacter sp. SYSU D00693]
MGDVRLVLVPALLLAAIVAVLWSTAQRSAQALVRPEADGAQYRLTDAAADAAHVRKVPAPGPLTFAPGTLDGDRRAVLRAVAAARPEARRLVDAVAGLTTVSVGTLRPGVAGEARTDDGRYRVTLDLAAAARYGERGTIRLTLHELGHVVDYALVTTALERRLDAAIPAGWGCDDGGVSGGCAAREERFAESFAKWAAGDIGVGVDLGYRVPPPPPDWGGPLAELR